MFTFQLEKWYKLSSFDIVLGKNHNEPQNVECRKSTGSAQIAERFEPNTVL